MVKLLDVYSALLKLCHVDARNLPIDCMMCLNSEVLSSIIQVPVSRAVLCEQFDQTKTLHHRGIIDTNTDPFCVMLHGSICVLV
jgi:hypothetical protein